MNIKDRYRLNGILVTVIFHLVLLLFFIIYKFGEAQKEPEPIEVSIVEDTKTVEEFLSMKKVLQEEEGFSYYGEAARNVAVNVSDKINDEISTDKYVESVKEELGIEELNQQLERDLPEEEFPVYEEKKPKIKEQKKPEQYKGRATVNYSLENRWHRRQYIPVYRCEKAGIVVVDIIVDQTGNVISATYSGDSNTKDPCLVEEAINSSYKFLFNADSNAESRQKGIISYQFYAQ